MVSRGGIEPPTRRLRVARKKSSIAADLGKMGSAFFLRGRSKPLSDPCFGIRRKILQALIAVSTLPRQAPWAAIGVRCPEQGLDCPSDRTRRGVLGSTTAASVPRRAAPSSPTTRHWPCQDEKYSVFKIGQWSSTRSRNGTARPPLLTEYYRI
jgi:hypothetical protein